jgi:hypothetical protein
MNRQITCAASGTNLPPTLHFFKFVFGHAGAATPVMYGQPCRPLTVETISEAIAQAGLPFDAVMDDLGYVGHMTLEDAATVAVEV